MKMVVIPLDSLNRHLLGDHGSHELTTPNLTRFSRPAGTIAPLGVYDAAREIAGCFRVPLG
jgi:hypothetical protein